MSRMAEKSSKKDAMKDIFYNFASKTTIHSISKQATPETPFFRRLVWLCLFVASLCYWFYQTKELVALFISRPVMVRNEWTTSRRLAFPAVTICNLNPFRKSKISSSTFWEEISNENSTLWGLGNSQERHIRRTLDTFINIINDTERRRLGHQAKDFIVKCTWKEENCKENFTQNLSPTYGNCYTFNSKDTGQTLYATSTGDEEPLSLTLNVEGDEYVGAVSPYLGVILEVHHPNVMPFPIQEGLKMSPGFSTNIGISMKQFVRLGDPYTKCRDEKEVLYSKKQYSIHLCLKLCQANLSLENCGCVKPVYNINPPCSPFNITHNTVETCLLFVETKGKCLYQMEGFLLDKALQACNCFPPCRETIFEYWSSFSVWPSEQSWKYIKQDLANRTIAASVLSLEKARENLLNIHIFYKTFGFSTTVEMEGYKLENLIGDLGGQLGLFVGMSLLSLAEVIELIIDLMARVLKRSETTVRSIHITSQVKIET